MALANTALSVSNWQQALKVPAALGLDPRAAKLLQAAVASRPASLLPPGESPPLTRSLLDWHHYIGRKGLEKVQVHRRQKAKSGTTISEAGGALGVWHREALRHICMHMQRV